MLESSTRTTIENPSSTRSVGGDGAESGAPLSAPSAGTAAMNVGSPAVGLFLAIFAILLDL